MLSMSEIRAANARSSVAPVATSPAHYTSEDVAIVIGALVPAIKARTVRRAIGVKTFFGNVAESYRYHSSLV